MSTLSSPGLIACLALAAPLLLPAAAAGVVVFENAQRGQELDVYFQIQMWNVATFGAQDRSGRAADDRVDLYIRRGRYGIKGSARRDIRFQFTFAYDNVGKNSLTAATGTPQPVDDREYYLWDGYALIALEQSWANLTAGYFRPQFGRESITSAFNVNSFTKALSNTYPRTHVVGRSNARETGLNLGGLGRLADGVTLNYNLGWFDTNHPRTIGTDNGGLRWSPLWAGRLALSLGDPEMDHYDLGYIVNGFNLRRGMTLAVNGTTQGRTNERVDGEGRYAGGFAHNRAWGADLLANWGSLNLSAEYVRLTRGFSDAFVREHGAVRAAEFTDTVWFVRAGWNFPLRGGRVLEPVAMYSAFDGDQDSVFWARGQDRVLDIGLNWYLDRNRAKVILHWVQQEGRPRSAYAAADGEARGDFLGMGLQLQF